MDTREFDNQVSRLASAFGSSAFNSERQKRIWMQVKDLPGHWFARIVDGMIDSMRHAPLPQDFQNAALEERNRLYEEEKARNRRDAEKFMKGDLPDEEVRFIVGNITARMRGEVADGQWDSFMKLLERGRRG